MTTAQPIRSLITQVTSGTVRLRTPREVRERATSSQRNPERKAAIDLPAEKM
jgi:hypothetical protein